MSFEPGDVYLFNEGDDKQRPVLIVSREELNRGNYVVAVPFTTRNLDIRRSLPNCVAFNQGEFGLDKNCVAQAEAITLFRKEEFDLERGVVARVDDEKMRDVIKAIGYVISSDCEPQ